MTQDVEKEIILQESAENITGKDLLNQILAWGFFREKEFEGSTHPSIDDLIEIFSTNKQIGKIDKLNLIEPLGKLQIKDFIAFYKCFPNEDPDIYFAIIGKVGKISIEEFGEFLDQDENIKLKIVQQVGNISLDEYRQFLANSPNESVELLKILSQKINEITIENFTKFIEDFPNIDESIKENISYKIGISSLGNIIEFLKKYRDRYHYLDLIIGHNKLEKFSLSELENFLTLFPERQDFLKVHVLFRLKVISLNDFIEFTNKFPNLPESIIKNIVEKVGQISIDEYLEAINKFPNYKIIRNSGTISLDDFIEFMENNPNNKELKDILLHKIGILSFEEIVKFINKFPDEELYISILSLKVGKISMDELINFFDIFKGKVNQDFLLILLRKVKNMKIKDIFKFIERFPNFKGLIGSYFPFWQGDEYKELGSISIEDFKLLMEKLPDLYETVKVEIAKQIAFDITDESIEGILNAAGTTISKTRKTKLVNERQLKLLGRNTKAGIPKNRNLVLYIRGSQGSYRPHYDIISKVLQEFIKRSQVWTNVEIQARNPTDQYQGKLGGLGVQFVSGERFITATEIMADTIHLSHGSPGKTPGTYSLLCQSIIKDKAKMEGVSSGEPVELNYHFDASNRTARYLLEDNDGIGFPLDKTIEEVCGILIKALVKLENKIVTDSIPPNIKANV